MPIGFLPLASPTARTAVGTTDAACDLAVRTGLAARDVSQRAPDRSLEVGSAHRNRQAVDRRQIPSK